MARILRSRSMRLLTGGQKGTHQQEPDRTTPPPSDFRLQSERLKAASPVSRAGKRVETPDMSQQRPRTAGGPGDQEKLFHTKVAPTASLSTEDAAFDFPFTLQQNKSTSVLYTAEIHEERDGVIGIALGSPTMASYTTNFVTSQHGPVTSISSNGTSHNYLPEPSDTKQDSTKPKLSRWKSMFKKSPALQQQNSFYRLAQEVSQARTNGHYDDESLDSQTMSPLERLPSPPTFKPEIRESRKLPKGHPQPPTETRPHALTTGVTKPKSAFLRSASSPRPPPKDFSSTVPQVVISGSQNSASSRTYGDRPLLDIDIPSIQLERYSVMFAGCSNLPLSNASSNTPSSLLARRQGNSERLRPLNELSKKNEDDGTQNGTLNLQRRATSPAFPKSPSIGLSLFPQPMDGDRRRTPSPRVISTDRARPLQRSMTAPASSPSRQNFSKPWPFTDRAREASQDLKTAQNEDLGAGIQTQYLTPTDSTTPTLSDGRSFESESESDSEETTIFRAQDASWKPIINENEPKWEIIKKPTFTNPLTQNPVFHKGPSSAPLESETQITSPTTAPRSAELASTSNKIPSQNEAKATIGLARSISVSRANKPEFLRPMLVKRATEGAERLVDRRALTPTLVELKNRKSQRVQLVEA